MDETFKPDWRSLREHATPQWLKDAKFGIYTHWGPYSVAACGKNGSWYPYNMYRPETSRDPAQTDYHRRTYGGPERFGYKDFIPLFTAEKFDPDEWADLFKAAGARFAGPVGEHHDGFTMGDTRLSTWNAVRMGPKRDVVGELERSIRGQGMRFMVALHHAENWWFYPHWVKEYDTADPRYAGCLGWPSGQIRITSVAPLLYESEIRSVTLLGHDGDLTWRLTPEALIIDTPRERPCDHAYAFKITRGRPF